MLSRSLSLLGFSLVLAATQPALAVVGGVTPRDTQGTRASTVRVETSRGELCSGAVIAPQIVLTAAHCLMDGSSISVVSLDPRFKPRRQLVVAVLPHPSFVPGTTPRTQPGTDLALLRLAQPLPDDMQPLSLGGGLWQGETVTMAGYGLSSENNKRSARRLRETQLLNVGNYTTQNTVKVAVDIESRGETPGAGACRGDSGGPVIRGSARSRDLVGIVSWSSGPLRTQARLICGGFTAITPVSEHRDWISQGSARLLALGSALQPDEAGRPQASSEWSWWFSR
ncbi:MULTISPECIES: trypsin-like serine protease [unclassified Bosea (in: a-proteobacteria)]|uniref:S1 family peptidase n=1 Tax=unclassified Bosea (in: a-proteobacteria) TaxID=2653178 RepID=UPI000954DA08|nr:MULTISPECIES: trypsin-like serine protease [unclassified Bosea (in: a-proteobacteria)]TAJ34235.1 MAG: trypsin-like serine protease [Bosea sp. (in: a-proteobacteria)]SIQ01788.1 Trypsin [Bosea sp. TND4EK4]